MDQGCASGQKRETQQYRNKKSTSWSYLEIPLGIAPRSGKNWGTNCQPIIGSCSSLMSSSFPDSLSSSLALKYFFQLSQIYPANTAIAVSYRLFAPEVTGLATLHPNANVWGLLSHRAPRSPGSHVNLLVLLLFLVLLVLPAFLVLLFLLFLVCVLLVQNRNEIRNTKNSYNIYKRRPSLNKLLVVVGLL